MKSVACNLSVRSHASGEQKALCLAILLAVLGFGTVLFANQKDVGPENKAMQIRARTRIEIFAPDDKPFNMPTDVAVGKDGSVYVLDGVNNRVVVYDNKGNFSFKFGSLGIDAGQFKFPLGISTAPDGKVYIADSGNHRFQIFGPDGKPLDAINLPAAGLTTPPDPTDMVVDTSRSLLYIVDNNNHHINIYNLSKRVFEKTLGTPGLGERQFRYPFFIDISAEGYIFVVEPINTRVQVLSPSGKFVSFIGGWGIKPGQLYRPKGVAIFGDKVFVSDSYLGRIQVFDVTGNFIGLLTDSSGIPVKFTTPTGIAIDAKRKCLYVVELKANRICRMDLE